MVTAVLAAKISAETPKKKDCLARIALSLGR